MQKGGEGVQIACKIAYVLNGRPLSDFSKDCKDSIHLGTVMFIPILFQVFLGGFLYKIIVNRCAFLKR